MLEGFKKFKQSIGKQSEQPLKVLRTDRGGEFVSTAYEKFCEDYDIQRQLTSSYTPQHNGVVERKNRSLVEMVLKAKCLTKNFWADAYILNRSPTSVLCNQTTFEAWYGWKPKVLILKISGV